MGRQIGVMTALAAVAAASAAAAASQAGPARRITADLAAPAHPRDMAWKSSVGADHPGILLRPANLDQLRTVRREIGFEAIRFHGILHDDMDVYHEVDGRPVYDFSKVDAVYDAIRGLGMRPFVEIGFMPKDLASGPETIFWWKGRGVPPKDWGRWGDLMGAFARNLEARYGKTEVERWRFEVWNEPNLDGFWRGGDKAAYFHLYDVTARALKGVDPKLQVGGPATAGAAWIPDLIDHAVEAGVPIDFISTHTYGVQGGFLDERGQADQKLSPDPDSIVGDVRRVHEQVLASARPDLPVHFTEWSTSYSPRDPVHDAYISAPFILEKLKRVEGLAATMSYWTYTDLFEEPGPPTTPFQGGFGLLTRDGVRKAAFFAYKYLNELGPLELPDADAHSWLTRAGDGFAGLVWDYTAPHQDESNRPYFRKLHPAAPVAPIDLELRSLKPGRYRLTVRRTGYRANDAYSRYIDWGLPDSLTPQQLETLRADAADRPETDQIVSVGADGRFSREIPLRTNDVVLVTLKRAGQS